MELEAEAREADYIAGATNDDDSELAAFLRMSPSMFVSPAHAACMTY